MIQNNSILSKTLPRLLKHYSAVIGPSIELTPQTHKFSATIHNGVDTEQFYPLAVEEKHLLKRKR